MIRPVRAAKIDLLALAVRQVLRRCRARSGPARARSVGSRLRSPPRLKSSSRCGDFLAAEGFLLNHLQILADDLAFLVAAARRAGTEQVARAGASRASLQKAMLASGLLISWATPAARKPTLASRSERTSCRLRSLTCRARSRYISRSRPRHVVEGVGQVLHFVAAVDLDAMLEIALGDPADARFAGRGWGRRPRR